MQGEQEIGAKKRKSQERERVRRRATARQKESEAARLGYGTMEQRSAASVRVNGDYGRATGYGLRAGECTQQVRGALDPCKSPGGVGLIAGRSVAGTAGTTAVDEECVQNGLGQRVGCCTERAARALARAQEGRSGTGTGSRDREGDPGNPGLTRETGSHSRRPSQAIQSSQASQFPLNRLLVRVGQSWQSRQRA